MAEPTAILLPLGCKQPLSHPALPPMGGNLPACEPKQSPETLECLSARQPSKNIIPLSLLLPLPY